MIKKTISAVLISLTFVVFSAAKSIALELPEKLSIAVGIAGNAGVFVASGTEFEGIGNATDGLTDQTNSSDRAQEVAMGSIFVDFTVADRVTIGFDYTPGAVETETAGRTDNVYGNDAYDAGANGTSSVADIGNTGTSTVKAEVENLRKAYAEIHLISGIYIKAGYMEMDLNTMENLHSESSYGNITLKGNQYGIGHKSTFADGSWIVKTEVTHENWDNFEIKSSTGVNKVTGRLEGMQGRIAIAKSF